MPANPIQRKSRNSFFLGVLVMLIIAVIVGGFLYITTINKEKKKIEEEKAQNGEKVIAYVLNRDVRSGEIITEDLLSQIEIYSSMLPSNYIDNEQLINITYQDEGGNILYTSSNSKRSKYIILEDNTYYKNVKNDDEKEEKDKVLIEKDTNGFYKTKKNGEKEYIQLIQVPMIAKIDMYKNSVLTIDSIQRGEKTRNDLRLVDYNMIVLPMDLSVGDYIDVRLQLANGQDLIVLSKKEVKNIFGNTISLNLTEEEILMMNSAIVESYIMTASNLYAIEYIEPGMQTAVQLTYVPTTEVRNLITNNPNITNEAKIALVSRFDAITPGTESNYVRDQITIQTSKYDDRRQDNIEEGIQDQIEAAIKAREAYLSGLDGY